MSDDRKDCFDKNFKPCLRCFNGWVAVVFGTFYLEPTFGATRSAVISNFEKLEGKSSWRKHRRVGNVKSVKVRFVQVK